MSYIGSTPTSQAFAPGTDTFSGDGTTVAFTLSRNVATVNDILVVVNNVDQQPTAYTVSGSTLTFSAAPSSGTNNIYVRYLSTNLITIAPQQGSVVPSSLSTPNALYWDTSGNVGIGTTTPATKLNVSQSNTSVGVLFNGTTRAVRFGFDTTGSIIEGVDNTGVTSYQPLTVGGVDVRFTTGSASQTERMRLDSSGNLSIGTTGSSGKFTVIQSNVAVGAYFQSNTASAGYHGVYSESQNSYGLYGKTYSSSYGGTLGFNHNNTVFGILGYTSYGLYTNASINVNGTVYASDARLKENVKPINNALEKITKLNPVSFDWKANSARGITNNNSPLPDYGMIAQEVEKVLSDIVYETAVPPKPLDIDNPNTLEQDLGSCKGVDYSRLIPFLTAAIQEQQAMIEELKTKVAALEAR